MLGEMEMNTTVDCRSEAGASILEREWETSAGISLMG